MSSGQSLFDRIEETCDQFRRDWQQGKSPQIEALISRVPEVARPSLFKNLLHEEIRLSGDTSQALTTEDCLRRFPNFSQQVNETFVESTEMWCADHQGRSLNGQLEAFTSPGQTDERLVDQPAASIIGEYQLLERLGAGAFGVVYRARHLRRGTIVALKTLKESDPDRLLSFRHEFRSVAELNHPNVVGMRDLAVDSGQWYLTMDLVEGSSFLEYVRPDDKLDQFKLRSVLPQLVRGINALHHAGVVHRDLKPGNVLVENGGQLIVLDFGLAMRDDGGAEATPAGFAGTPVYAAPEQFLSEPSKASDWYAVGVMLYEALTGRRPFVGTLAEIFNSKTNADAPQLSGQSDVAPDLAELVDDLLLRDPAQRPDAPAIMSTLNVSLDMLVRSPGDADGQLIGREHQHRQLTAALDSVVNNREPAVAFVRGRSGEGKSSLVEMFLKPLRRYSRLLVLSGRCYERESVPFKAIDCWMDSLVDYLRAQSPARLEKILPADITGLARIFPVLLGVPTIESMPSIDSALMTPEKLRHRAFAALKSLLVSISRETPIILFIDDLQWGDADSANIFNQFLNDLGPPLLMFLGSYRSDEGDESSFVQQWNQQAWQQDVQLINIGPLSEHQAFEMITDLIPRSSQVPQEELQRVCRESGGNPYILQQLMEGYDPQTKTFRPLPLQEVIRGRLDRLPSDAKPLLEMLAVAGHALAADSAGLLAGLGEPSVATLIGMRNEKLIRWLGTGERQQIDTFHDRIRETVSEMLPATQRRNWHRVIGEGLEQTPNIRCEEYPPFDDYGEETQLPQIPNLFDLAHHFHAADDPRALVYLILAGEQALRVYSNHDATELLSRAEKMLDDDRPDEYRFRILFGQGLANVRRREAEKAIELLESARPYATNRSHNIRLESALGVAHENLGRARRSIDCLDRVLNHLGRRRPQTLLGKLFRVGRDVPRIVLAPGWQLRRVTEQSKRRAMAEFRALERLRFSVAQVDLFSMLDCGFHTCVAAFRSRDPALVSIGHSCASFMFALFGSPTLYRLCYGRYVKASGQSDSRPELLASALWHDAMAAYGVGDFARSMPVIRQAYSASVQCGANSESLFALHLERHLSAWTGSAKEELAVAHQEYELAVEMGDPKGVCWASYGVAEPLARSGQLDAAAKWLQQAYATLTREPWYSTEPVCRATHGYFHLQASNYEAAAAILRMSWQMTKRQWMFHNFNCFALPLYLDAVLGPDWQHARGGATSSKSIVRWIRAFFRSFPVLQPMMLRSLGRHAAAMGRPPRAIRLLQRSLSLCTERNMPYHRARALLDIAAIEDNGQRDKRDEAIGLLRETSSVIPRAESWLLGEQYDEAVVAPEFDLAAWEREHELIDSTSLRI